MTRILLLIIIALVCMTMQAQEENVITDGVTFSADRKTLIEYPRKKTDKEYVIPEGTEVIGESAFIGNSYLKQVSIPTSLNEIGDYAFQACQNLTTIVWGTYPPNIGEDIFGFEYDNTPIEIFRIPDNNKDYTLIDGILFSADKKKLLRAPRHCSTIASHYSVPEGTEIIAKQAFEGTSMYMVILPASLKLIEDRAFWVEARVPVRSNEMSEYRRIYSLTCLAAIPPVLDGDPFVGLYGIYLTVPEEYFDTYGESPVWSRFMYINGKFVSVKEHMFKKSVMTVEGQTVHVIGERVISGLKVFAQNGTLLVDKSVSGQSCSFDLDESLQGILMLEVNYADGKREVFKFSK